MNNLLSIMASTLVINDEFITTINSFLKKILNKLKKPNKHKQHTYYDAGLEAYIVANNPQTTADVEELERRYERRRKDLNIYEHAKWL